MDILDKLVKFLDENYVELREVLGYKKQLGMIEQFVLKPEDRSKFKNEKFCIEGPNARLIHTLLYMADTLKSDIVEFKSDKRSREEKYNDSLEFALKLEKIWNI